MSNTVKFSEAGGTVEINGKRDAEGPFALEVIDTGIGMDGVGIEKETAKFGQVYSNILTHSEGTGLGLPLTDGLVAAHGGPLVIESQPGVGTTVKITFPKERII